jgi:hypothetical protein
MRDGKAGDGPDMEGEEDGAVVVSGPLGPPRLLRPGGRLTFGRGGPEVDLPLGPDDRWLSRKVGEITVDAGGVRIVNLSRKHALIVRSGDLGLDGPAPSLREPVRLRPRLPDDPAEACVLSAGSALVGSALMLQEYRAVHVRLPGAGPAAEPVLPQASGRRSSTVAGITMNPETREVRVAVQLCAPWLRNAARVDPLPSGPEIGPLALESVGRTYLADRTRGDEELRKRLNGKVHDHLKALRKKLVARALLPDEGTVGNTAIAAALVHYDILGERHLALFANDYWRDVQANQWATCLE